MFHLSNVKAKTKAPNIRFCYDWPWTPFATQLGPRPSNDWLGIASPADKSALSATKVERQGSIKENRCVSGKVIGADGGTHLSLGGPPTRPVSLLGEIIFEWDPVPPAPRSPCPPKWPPMKWIDAWRPSYCLILCLVDARWWLIVDYFTEYLLEMVTALVSKLFVIIRCKDDIATDTMTRFIWHYMSGKQ